MILAQSLRAGTEPAGCHCDALATEPGLLPLDAALDRISQLVQPLARNRIVPLEQASGRVLAEPVLAVQNSPRFDNSAMDGYALDLDTFTGQGPWTRRVSHCIYAGALAKTDVGDGEVCQIFTGAVLPDWAGAVIMQEQVDRIGDYITFDRLPERGENIRQAGEDIQCGQAVLPAGTVLGPRQIAAAATVGSASFSVKDRLRVALVITGDEVRCVGSELSDAAIWDANTPMLTAAIARRGVDLVEVIHCRDQPAALRGDLERLANQVDLIVTTGGVSVGAADYVKPVFQEMGAEISLSGVAVKPGKPVSFGRLGQALWLGLPGNPVSAFVIWHLFGERVLANLTGQKRIGTHPRRHVVASDILLHRTGRSELRLATLSGFSSQGYEVVTCAQATHSARVLPLSACDGVIVIPADVEEVAQGTLLEFLPFGTTQG